MNLIPNPLFYQVLFPQSTIAQVKKKNIYKLTALFIALHQTTTLCKISILKMSTIQIINKYY